MREGNLRDSIRAVVYGATGKIIALVHYAGFVELGTRKMGAQPYLRPAVDEIDWDRIIRQGLSRLMGL